FLEQRLYEQRLYEDAPMERTPPPPDSGSRASKSLTVAIQELNLRLRLASSAAPPPAPIDNPERARPNDPGIAAAPAKQEAPSAAREAISIDRNPCPPQQGQTPASLPRSDSGDGRFLKKVTGKLDARLAAATSSDLYRVLGVDRLASNGSITRT